MLTKLKLSLLVAAPLVAGATSYAVAQGDAPARKDLIQKFSPCQSRSVTAPASRSPPASRDGTRDPFGDLPEGFDKNGDGTLDAAERAEMQAAFEAKRAERHQEMLAKYDTNHDGKLDAAEHQAMRDDRLATRFQAMDKDGDGKLTLDEFKAGAGAGGAFHRHGRRGHGHPHRAITSDGGERGGASGVPR